MLAKIFLGFPAIVVAATFGANAQDLRNTAEPAELPPPSFGGAQYVDSSGCVFLRAGVNGNAIWVPRVTRSRKLVCGRSPTFSAVAATAATVQSEPAPASAVRLVSATHAVPAVAPSQTVARRVVPVAGQQTAPAVAAPAQVRISVPAGFRSAWTDGRLNPKRGPRTAEGDTQMALIWTNTVPRRLIVQK